MSDSILKQYQTTPTPELERQLLDTHQSYINAISSKWKGTLPESVINARAQRHAIDAFKTYKTGTGANIQTHLHNHLSQLDRFVGDHSNVSHIPEHQRQQIGKVNQATNFLQDKLDRQPTELEISKHLKMKLPHIQRIIRNKRADFINDSDSEMSGPQVHDHTKANQIFAYRQELKPLERKQFDAITGYNQPAMSPKQVGQQFNLKPYEVSRLKSRFAQGLK